ncbi:MAG: ABC transporter ATP-binding protein, partial [Colwellia sp.]
MLKLISELFGLLTNEQRRRFWILQLLVILMAIFELIGVASIFPFIAIVSDSSVIESNNLINLAYVWSSSQSHSEFLLLVGVSVLIILAISSIVSIFTSWRLAMFAAQIGT